MGIKVTIGLSFYNNEETLEATIKSIIMQSYKNWNLILVNDGSSDNSLEIAKKFRDERILLISDNNNKGLIRRLNEMIDLTETKYFFRMDSDDLMHPNRLEKQINYLMENPDVDIVGSSAVIIDENNNVLGIRDSPKIGIDRSETLMTTPFIHPSVAGKTEWFKKNKYHEDFFRSEDYELWNRTISTSNFKNIKEPLLFYRDTTTINKNNYFSSLKTGRKVVRKYCENSLTKFLLLSKSFSKEILMKIIILAHKEEEWKNKKNKRNLDSQKSIQYKEILNKLYDY